MRRLFLLSLLVFFHFVLLAQRPVTLKGRVVDSVSQLPVGATVSLLGTRRSVAADSNGAFEIVVQAGRAYMLRITAVGYRPKDIAAAEGMNKIELAADLTALEGAVVTASRHVVKQEIDRISYDVQADPDSKANDALEMLRKVPMVTVDANDVVQLKGSTNFQIFINGKPSALMVASASDVLKAMPAATIQRIEVITLPPSKYDGEGLVGIINIITLKSTADGVNGSLFARYNSVFGERGSASVNVNKGRFSLTGLVGLGREPDLTVAAGSTLTTYSPASVLSQQGERSENGNFNNGKVDLSYEVDSSSLLTASGDFFNRRFQQAVSTFSTLVYAPDSLAESYQLRNSGPVNASALDAAVGYQLKFGRAREASLNLFYRYAYTSNDQANTVTISDPFHYTGTGYTQSNSLRTKTHNVELELIRPLGRVVVEAGAKVILGTNDSYSSYENEVNVFSYRQNIYSAYNSYHVKMADWEVKSGLRLENTVINSSFSQGSSAVDQNYLSLLPTVSVQRNLVANSSVVLGFTQRIQRATARQLNPFLDQSNPAFLVTGNPALRPVVNNIVQLDYSRSARLSVNASVDYMFSNNPIESVTEQLSDTVLESTYQNVGRNQSAGTNLTFNYTFFTKLNLILNTRLSHLWITGTYNSQYYKNDGTQGDAAASARWSFAHQLTATVTFNYNSGAVYLQGKSSSYTYVGFNIIKEFFDRRATLSITAFSPWAKFSHYTSSTITPDFAQYSTGEFYHRNFRFAFNYKFGKLKPGAPRSKGEEE